ncbi:TPR/glycosyl transferase domain protein [Algibacter lectus]|uniref:TPR/glycosyl transferase domain protein n=1 Tax=Algibacter lectus TaxID=221126 RepID=A0A090X6H1_9FLAO|nr:TPR/glycosyl transferase domain protein [Algibacter lectus]
MQLKEKLGVKWIADFRDPWTTIGYHKQLKLTEKSKQKHKALEKLVLNTADDIVVTSSVTKTEFEAITNKPIEVITNGYDYESVESKPLDAKFTIAHIGSLLSKRNPIILWQVLSELVQEHEGFSKDFQLNFVGAVSETVLQSIETVGLANHVNNAGYVSHKESIIYQKSSQVLLLVEIDSKETKCIIPGKLFEYMVSNRPILALGPQGSDVENIIKETNTGNYFYYTDYKSLKSTILAHYKSYQNKNLEVHAIGLQKYSRKSLTSKLASVLKKP